MGSDTVEVRMVTAAGEYTASVPAGISAGKYEVSKVSPEEAIVQIDEFKKELTGKEFNQLGLDEILNKSNLGGNAKLAVSAAFWKSEVRSKLRKYQKFPKLFTLMFEGGKHGNPEITIQEIAVVEDTVNTAVIDFQVLKKYLENQGTETTVGAEGAFSPKDWDNERVLQTISDVFGEKKMALDMAGSFIPDSLNIKEIIAKYPVFSVEDPFDDESWNEWKTFYEDYKDKILIVGDDLTATNPIRLQMATNPRVINAMVIKPNQNGTISGTIETAKIARENGIATVVSHRGEETDDDWLVDLALEIEADYVKFGGLERGERVAKYNRLRELGMT